MMREDKEWTETVGRKLRGAEEPVPAEGWERLCREWRPSVASQVRKPRMNGWRYAAAVASILVCVSIGVRVLRIDHNVMKKGVVSVSETTVGGPHEGVGTASVPTPSSCIAAAEPRLAERTAERGEISGTGSASERALRAVASVSPERTDEVVSLAEARQEQREAGKDAARRFVGTDGSSEGTAELRPAVEGGGSVGSLFDDGLFAAAELPERSVRRRGAVSLFAAGVVGGGGDALLGLQRSGLPMETSAVSALRTGYDEYVFRHRQTVSFGATFRKELCRGFSLETGLNYSLLRSDVSLPGMERDIRQRLHLVGIPLRVNWQFLRAGRFGMYVGAGGMAELCVGARFGDDRVRERGVLWSVSGLLGAQYRLGGHTALFFEPAATHYLTHTTLRTAYTDSKVALDLRLGVRFTY